MQLSDFKLAWEQLKLANSLQGLESREILMLLEQVEETQKAKSLRVLLNIGMFLVILIICQSG